MKSIRITHKRTDMQILQRAFEKDVAHAQQKLSILLEYSIDKYVINELMWQWRTTMQPFHNGDAAVKKETIERELQRIEITIQRLNTAMIGLKAYNNIDITSIKSILEPSNNCDEEITSIANKIKNLQKRQLYLIMAEKDRLDNKKVLFYALLQIFYSGEKLGLRIGKAYAGKGNKNKLFEFVKIITGIKDYKKLHRYYSKYKQIPPIPKNIMNNESCCQ